MKSRRVVGVEDRDCESVPEMKRIIDVSCRRVLKDVLDLMVYSYCICMAYACLLNGLFCQRLQRHLGNLLFET
jgi:hypothetical protein